ncbi:MAG: hypothetical protein UY70_C0016G0003 [Candidatus Kaiserbacteria bacterium GW2011_GWB1_52_6]|uniref:Uncharacterized protein n=1 Tax=Candidatus Kaiserbacteria bacterium GW2011_GWB1_52_6 TaxID=1618674 RepID=A0A0G2A509_9BACT|nr:MAG: hypothetical protein UY70_C0016G0003 [Candidatus Kaiserbacteria bacterium GW2011_GWB1_52_6]
MSKSAITVINDENMRGIIAPSSAISEEMLEDLVDLVEMSDPKFVAKINGEFKKTKKWFDGPTLRKELGV